MRVPAFSSFFRYEVHRNEMIILFVTQDRSLIPRHAWKYEFSKTSIKRINTDLNTRLLLSEVMPVKLYIPFRISNLQEETSNLRAKRCLLYFYFVLKTFARWRLTKRGLLVRVKSIDTTALLFLISEKIETCRDRIIHVSHKISYLLNYYLKRLL